jgi:hypothetical protein
LFWLVNSSTPPFSVRELGFSMSPKKGWRMFLNIGTGHSTPQTSRKKQNWNFCW